MSRPLLVTTAEGVALLTLNRPEASNALSAELRHDLARTLRDLRARPDIRAVVLTASGGRAFCAGLDRTELPSLLERIATGSPAFDDDVAALLETHPTPVVAAVDGIAMTGGLELMLACDIVVASPEARFADTHTRVGVAPMWGMTQRLPRRIGVGRAKLMSLTARWVNAEEALAWGLVDEVVEPGLTASRAMEIAAAIASGDRSVAALCRTLMNQAPGLALTEGLNLERLEATRVNEVKARQQSGRET